MNARHIFLPALLLSGTCLAATDLAFTASLDRQTAGLGDRVTATYEAVLPEGSKVEVETLVSPLLGAPGNGPVLDFPVKPSEKIETTPSGLRYRLEVPFVPFQTGTIPIPAPKLVVVLPGGEKRPVRPAQLELKVASHLPKDQKAEELAAKSDRPPVVPPISPWVWASLAAGLSLLGILGWWLWKRRQNRPEAVAEAPQTTPSEEYLASLAKLARSVPAPGADARGYYSELTHSIKRYLERRLDKPVLEWTTFETLRRLREAGLEFAPEIGLAELLGSADRVKFARAGATSAEAEAHLARARALHDELERRLAPPPVTVKQEETSQAAR